MDELALFGVAETLRDISARTATGMLRAGAGGKFRLAFFESGDLV